MIPERAPVTDRRPRRKAFAVALVLWAIALCAILIVGVQSAAFRASSAGRETLARVRAHWAARAGVEATLARLQELTLQSEPVGAAQMLSDLALDARGTLKGGSFEVGYTSPQGFMLGVSDAHAKLNVNLLAYDDLMLLPGMTDDAATAIVEWTSPDDGTGLSAQNYAGMPIPYEPRFAPLRELQELELCTGVRPQDVRGYDRDLNGIIDDDELEAAGTPGRPATLSGTPSDFGWSGLLTAASVDGGLAPDGRPRLDLATAQAGDLTRVVEGLNDTQASVILAYGQYAAALAAPAAASTSAGGATSGAGGATQAPPTPVMEDFINRSLLQLAQVVARSGITIQGVTAATGPGGGQVRALTVEQLAQLYDYCTLNAAAPPAPGKLNVNTASDEVLTYLTLLTATERDAIILYRNENQGDVVSVIDLLNIPQMTRQRLAQIAPFLTTHSNVYTLTSRGTDATTGLQVEMTVELDRSTLPVTVRSLRVR